MPKSIDQSRWLSGFLLLLTAILYATSLGGDWIGDDILLVVNATCADSIEDIFAILRLESGQCNYRPLRYISYAFDNLLWGNDTPFGFRLTNLLIHLAACVVLFIIVQHFNPTQQIPWLIVGLFALHPVQVDSVAYVSGRRDVLMGLLYLLAVLAAMSSVANRPSNRIRSRLLAGAAFFACALALATKEMAISAPIVVVAILLIGDKWPLADSIKTRFHLRDLNKKLLKSWPPVLIAGVLSGGWLWYRGIQNPVSGLAGQLLGGDLGTHILTIFAVSSKYPEMLLVPIRLSGDYRPPVVDIPEGIWVVSVWIGIFWNATLLYWLYSSITKRHVTEAFGIAWYLVAMLPVSNIIPHHEYAAEHYLYIPIIGLSLTLSATLSRYIRRHPDRRPLITMLLVMLMTILAIRTATRISDYKNELSHANATLHWYPNSVRGHARRGLALLQKNDFDRARPSLEFVLASSPSDTVPRTDVLRELGIYYTNNGNYRLAERLLTEAQSLTDRQKRIDHHLAKLYVETDRLDDARQILERLFHQEPDDPIYCYFLASTALKQRDLQFADRIVQQCMTLTQSDLDVFLLGARIKVATKQFIDARELTQRVLDSEPTSAQRLEAIELWQQLQLKP